MEVHLFTPHNFHFVLNKVTEDKSVITYTYGQDLEPMGKADLVVILNSESQPIYQSVKAVKVSARLNSHAVIISDMNLNMGLRIAGEKIAGKYGISHVVATDLVEEINQLIGIVNYSRVHNIGELN